MPRYAVLGGHEHKAFCPMDNIFNLPPTCNPLSHAQSGSSSDMPAYDQSNHPHLILNAEVLSLTPTHITLNKSFPQHGEDFVSHEVKYDFLIYALGSKLPAPLDLWGTSPGGLTSSLGDSVERVVYRGAKPEGIAWLRAHQKLIEDAQSILVVGGGALGIQFATDIADIHPNKSVTLLHSRERLLPKFDPDMHTEIHLALESLGVKVILSERLADRDALPKYNERGQRVVKTTKGREIVADVVLMCTGQTPNTSILRTMDPSTVNPDNGLAHVLTTMQLAPPPVSDVGASSEQEKRTPYPHMFAVGDAADAFGAIAAGHTADFQAKVAANNILILVRACETKGEEQHIDQELEEYTPTEPGIKVSLGLTNYIYQINGEVGKHSDGAEDLNAAYLWKYWGATVEREEDMYA
ncbi:hypothetical protein VKT23_020156 [Stygiomarasmius scandens]|uniref:FAD/NAD(P)-binding domain-containing protein n=1 Tax=Marasmiellus scandens TaxID=2682957 RepID=A0ABR1IJN6_9AGAR